MNAAFGLLVLVAIVGELVVAARWWRPYFVHGVLLFRSRVALGLEADDMPSDDSLERRLGDGLGGSLLFRELLPDEVAFREPFYEWRVFSYFPVMHGLVRRDSIGRIVTVEGRANLFTCVSAGIVLAVTWSQAAWVFAAFFLAILAVSYALQARRYREIAEAVAGGLPSPSEPRTHTSRMGNYVAWLLLVALLMTGALALFAGRL